MDHWRWPLVASCLLAGALLVTSLLTPSLAETAQTPPEVTTTVMATTTPTTGSTPPVVQSAEPAASKSEIDQLNARVNSLAETAAESKSGINSLQSFLMWAFAPLAVLVGLLAAGGIVGIVNSVRMDNRAAQMHQLLVAGEATSQLRTEQSHVSFLEASQKTLNLVNETLELAKDASARAATSMAERATRKLNELSTRSRTELSPYVISGKFKELVTTPRTTKAALDIAGELLTLEGLFSLQDIVLTAPCLFMRGMERHLRQDPEAAITNLREAIAKPEGDQLADLAYYWIAYENNNLGDYTQAESTFRRARERAAQAGRDDIAVELFVRELESRFFGITAAFEVERLRTLQSPNTEDPQVAVSEVLRKSLAEIDAVEVDIGNPLPSTAGLLVPADKVATLRGNITTWRAAKWAALGHLPEAVGAWESAKSMFEVAAEGHADWYVPFGLLECEWQLHKLQGDPAPAPDRYASLAAQIFAQVEQRYEQRSRVLLQEANLICRGRAAVIAVRAGDAAADIAVAELRALEGTVHSELRDVRAEVTLYSAMSKVNVQRGAFIDEVRSLAAEFVEDMQRPSNDQLPERRLREEEPRGD